MTLSENMPHTPLRSTKVLIVILGVAIAALFRAVGLVADTRAVIHAVLMLEQMMTTGGGWQDQVGGMCKNFQRTELLFLEFNTLFCRYGRRD